MIIQERLAMPDTEVTKNERDTLLKIQAILYSTEVSGIYLTRVTHNCNIRHTGGLRGATDR